MEVEAGTGRSSSWASSDHNEPRAHTLSLPHGFAVLEMGGKAR